MKRVFLSTMIGMGLMLSTTVPGFAVTYQTRRQTYQTRRYIKHRRHVQTAKRVGIGAAGGAAIGALAGGGKGAGIGALAGAGAGALYDIHKKHQGR
jgi:outer membrane lipoprotein SlyB